MSKTYETILVGTRDGVATLTLNRPEKKNAMNIKLMTELTEALDEIADADDVRALILTGTGNSFTAGADLNMFAGQGSNDPMEGYNWHSITINLGEKLRLHPKTTIAAINGWALGWGFWLAMVCDFAIMAEDARIGVPQLTINAFPHSGTIKSLLTVMPHRYALYCLITGESLSAAEADKLFLVNKVVPREQLTEEVYRLANMVKERDPILVRFLKRSFWREKYMNYSEAIELEIMQATQAQSLRTNRDATPSGLEAVRGRRGRRP